MAKFTIRLHDKGRCNIKHESSGAVIISDLPPEYGGEGKSFSSTDLVTAALGSCTLTTFENILEREGYDPKKMTIVATKTLSSAPKRIKAIRLDIYFPEALDALVLEKLNRASAACPVKRSLNERIEITTIFRVEKNE